MRGPCAKRRVVCQITTRQGTVYRAENDCESPQAACPRLPGEDYTKCKTVCRQGGHAETEALALAESHGEDLTGARAILSGHHWVCEACGAALMKAGVRVIEVRFPSPTATGRIT